MNIQHCSTPDLLSVLVGEAMAKKLSQVPLSVLFGMRTNRQEMVCENEAQYVPAPINSQPDIVIGCVDNRKGRAAILKALKRSMYRASCYYLDIGNREHDGQVVLGEIFGESFKREHRLPHVADLYPDIIDGSLDATDDIQARTCYR